MEHKPLVSIITPVYNVEKYIKATIDSVLNQSFTDFELILVNDASKDNSESIIKEYKDPRIKYYSYKDNKGVSYARNYALDRVNGKYVTFLDSDDLLDHNYLERQVAFIKDNGPIISSGYRRMAENSISEFYPPKEITYKRLFKGNPLSCLSTMYDYELFKDIRFTLGYSRHEDLIFWYDMLSKGYVAKGNPEVLATYRIYNQSRNGTKRKLIKPIYNIYRKHFHFSVIKSWWYIFRMTLYSLRKYFGVK